MPSLGTFSPLALFVCLCIPTPRVMDAGQPRKGGSRKCCLEMQDFADVAKSAALAKGKLRRFA